MHPMFLNLIGTIKFENVITKTKCEVQNEE